MAEFRPNFALERRLYQLLAGSWVVPKIANTSDLEVFSKNEKPWRPGIWAAGKKMGGKNDIPGKTAGDSGWAATSLFWWALYVFVEKTSNKLDCLQSFLFEKYWISANGDIE